MDSNNRTHHVKVAKGEPLGNVYIGAEARLSPHGHYVILFRIENDVVFIERVAFGGRELPDLCSETD